MIKQESTILHDIGIPMHVESMSYTYKHMGVGRGSWVEFRMCRCDERRGEGEARRGEARARRGEAQAGRRRRAG